VIYCFWNKDSHPCLAIGDDPLSTALSTYSRFHTPPVIKVATAVCLLPPSKSVAVCAGQSVRGVDSCMSGYMAEGIAFSNAHAFCPPRSYHSASTISISVSALEICQNTTDLNPNHASKVRDWTKLLTSAICIGWRLR
jgi:hypothetical protein